VYNLVTNKRKDQYIRDLNIEYYFIQEKLMPEQPFENDSADENSSVDDNKIENDQEEVYSIKNEYCIII